MAFYMITDGTMYIRKDATGSFVPAKGKNLGLIFDTKSKADNVLNCCINKNLRKRYHVIEFEHHPLKKPKKNEPFTVKPHTEVVQNIGKQQIKDNSVTELSQKINGIATFVQSTEQRRTELNAALSDIDLEITDIEHYIEFGALNCYQGWLAYRMLKNRLRQRRQIKNELNILWKLGDCKINSQMISDIKKSIEELETLEYQPRKLKELFE